MVSFFVKFARLSAILAAPLVCLAASTAFAGNDNVIPFSPRQSQKKADVSAARAEACAEILSITPRTSTTLDKFLAELYPRELREKTSLDHWKVLRLLLAVIRDRQGDLSRTFYDNRDASHFLSASPDAGFENAEEAEPDEIQRDFIQLRIDSGRLDVNKPWRWNYSGLMSAWDARGFSGNTSRVHNKLDFLNHHAWPEPGQGLAEYMAQALLRGLKVADGPASPDWPPENPNADYTALEQEFARILAFKNPKQP